MSQSKIYLAAPFFNSEQVALVDKLEAVIEASGWHMFSPRLGANACEMNALIELKKIWVESDGMPEPSAPSSELRMRVFQDNYTNIDDADLLLAVIDDFDVGVMFEVGYAFARHVPIVTHTARDYGCNLMLAHSIVGHTKEVEEVVDILRIGNPSLSLDRGISVYGTAIAEIQMKYKTEFSLEEGADERSQ